MEKEIISQLIGILVNANVNAKEAIELLDQAKDTYLQRNWHIASDKPHDNENIHYVIDKETSIKDVVKKMMRESKMSHKSLPHSVYLTGVFVTYGDSRTIEVEIPLADGEMSVEDMIKKVMRESKELSKSLPYNVCLTGVFGIYGDLRTSEVGIPLIVPKNLFLKS